MEQSRLYCPEEEFTGRLRSRLPMNVLFSFTSEQLQALRTAFGTRFQKQHSVDLRWRVYLPWRRYYVVLQVGRDRRLDPRRSRGSAWLRMLTDTAGFGLMLAGLVSLGWLAVHAL